VLAVNEDQVTPGALGFLVVVALGVALFFLIRSMNKQIARIEAPYEEDLKQAEWERRQRADSTDDGAAQDSGTRNGAEG
jgi:flagellar biosynthesis/type III secretory pathway M-ring protein FliF/YscJ